MKSCFFQCCYGISFKLIFENQQISFLIFVSRNGKSDVDASHNDFVTHQLVEFSRFSGKDLKSHLVDNFSEIVLYFLPTFILSDKNPALAKKLCHKKEIDRAAQIHQVNRFNF